MAMLEIKDIHKTFYTYDDKPRFHIGPFPRGTARRVRSALHVLNGVDLSVERETLLPFWALPAPARPPCCAA